MKSCPHCGCDLSCGRSTPQLRRYFAMIRAAHHHWPESHQRRFDTPEALRKWLQMKAGHRDTHMAITIQSETNAGSVALAREVLRVADTYAEPTAHNGVLYVHVPKSIAFDKLSHKEACSLFEEVDAVIKDETGHSGSDYLREMEMFA